MQYAVAEYTSLMAEVLSKLKFASQAVSVSFCTMLLREPIFPAMLVKCVLNIRLLLQEFNKSYGAYQKHLTTNY